MDDNTFKILIAVITSVQVMVLAYFGVRQQQTTSRVNIVHDLVNGLSHDKDAAVDASARAQGELAGRDFETAKSAAMQVQIDANTAARIGLGETKNDS